jgi:hypothetical protein
LAIFGARLRSELWPALLGVPVYLALLWVTKGATREDISYLRSLMART